MIPAGARCGLHGDVAAVDLCKRCGRFLCGDCVQLVGEDAYCADCLGKLEKPASLMSRWAASLAATSWIAGLTGGMLREGSIILVGIALALSGFTLGFVELFRISRGRASPHGRVWAICALIIAAVPLGLIVVVSLT